MRGADSCPKVTSSARKSDPKEPYTVNEAEHKKSADLVCLLVLSKRLTSPKDKLDLEFCERVSKSRTVDKFMELNLLYFFDLEKVKRNKKATDSMIPYEFMVDLR